MSIHLPNTIFSGICGGGHIQGIAVDSQRGFVYYSFTTILLKTDLQGNLLGSVTNLVGHLGCITYDAKTNMVYGSLELKHDGIGNGIASRTGRELAAEDAFYLICFDVDRINRPDMDAEKDGIMRAVYLRDVVSDYAETDEASGNLHRYGCSGIDGVALGPVFGGDTGSPEKIMVAYGIYSDVGRGDNDHQVILQYDRSEFARFGQPLNQMQPHHSGPEHCEQRYFFYTGNTTYGVQNLEYDVFSRQWFVAVYPGNKEQFVNFPMFTIDGTQPAAHRPLAGRHNEQGLLLRSAGLGTPGTAGQANGSFFPYGSTGMASLGGGLFYFSQEQSNWKENCFSSTLVKYRYCPELPALFEPVTD